MYNFNNKNNQKVVVAIAIIFSSCNDRYNICISSRIVEVLKKSIIMIKLLITDDKEVKSIYREDPRRIYEDEEE